MDIKGVPWVGDVYQRFEALCVEVDETIYEDTVKYVGDQMRNVGETVKKFYSDVMQDLLPSSSIDSAKEKDVRVTVPDNGGAAIYCKENLDNESESVDAASPQMEKLSDGATIAKKFVGQQQYTPENPQSQSADLVPNQFASVENHLSNWQNQDPQLKSLSDSSSKDYNNIKNINPRRRVPPPKFSVEEWPYPESLYDRDIYSCRCKERISNEVSPVEVSQSNENVLEFSVERIEKNANINPAEGRQTQGESVGGVSTELDDSVVSMKAVVGTTTTNNNLDAVNVGNKRVSDAGDDKQGSLKLEESCILVERDDHFSESTVEDVQKSYKKKIREAFSTRRWSRSKRSSEQLAPRSEERRGKSLVSSSMVHTEIQNSQTSDSFESEWELL